MGEYYFRNGSNEPFKLTITAERATTDVHKFGMAIDPKNSDVAEFCRILISQRGDSPDNIGLQSIREAFNDAILAEQDTLPGDIVRLSPTAAESAANNLVSDDFLRACTVTSDLIQPGTDIGILADGINAEGAIQSQFNFRNANGALVTQSTVNPDGGSLRRNDPGNTHPYDKLDIATDADGKVIAAQVTLDPDVLAAGMSIGQIFGSAIGGALGGNSLVGNLAAGAIGGLIGQKFVQVLAISMTADLSNISLNDVFGSQGISVANAGFGVISSFLTAELGHALHIDGFDGQLFNTAASGFTTSLLIQVTDEMVRGGLDFAGTIAAMDWTQAVSNAIDVAEINLGNLLGSYLGHELVPAQTREAAIGGQLFGAIGGFILPGGLGALIGTIIGTLIGNQFGTPASPSAVDLLDQAGDHYGFGHYQSADGGGYDAPDRMAAAADSIIESYLSAVNGAALDHSKQVVIGYTKNPGVLYVTGVPGNANHSFVSADDAVHAAALDVLQHLEVIGGDLLMKRAHQNSPSNIPEAGPAGGGAPGQSQVSGADQLATMAGDLSVAQDYENYLNNREAINALIAANPDSALTRRSRARTTYACDEYRLAA